MNTEIFQKGVMIYQIFHFRKLEPTKVLCGARLCSRGARAVHNSALPRREQGDERKTEKIKFYSDKKLCFTHFNFSSLQVGECRWSKGGKPVGMFGGKYEMRGDTEQGDCSLTLHTLDLRIDDGQWQCQVSKLTTRPRVDKVKPKVWFKYCL